MTIQDSTVKCFAQLQSILLVHYIKHHLAIFHYFVLPRNCNFGDIHIYYLVLSLYSPHNQLSVVITLFLTLFTFTANSSMCSKTPTIGHL